MHSPDLDAQPDEGDLAELARAADRAKASAKWVADLDQEAARLLVEAESLRVRLYGDDLEPCTRFEFEHKLTEVEAATAKAYRKYVDARSRSAVIEARVAELESAGGAGRADPDIWRSASTLKTALQRRGS